MKNSYQKMMEDIHTPAGLNERVLRAAAQGRSTAGAPARRRRRPILRTAVCAACALALVLGTFQLQPVEDGGAEREDGGGPVTVVPTFSFGLTAYAAGGEEAYAPGPNSGIAFRAGEGSVTLDGGNYTGLLFRITSRPWTSPLTGAGCTATSSTRT